VVAVSDVDGTAHFVVAVNSSGQGAGINAGDLVKTVASVLGARGGGKADLAQGAGGDAGKAGEAFDAARAAIRALVARS
jgi:alanyl-tRNA synthetase